MKTGAGCSYVVDGADRVVAVDSGFREFASENAWPEGSTDAVLGRNFSSFIADAETRHLWRVLYARSRLGRRVVVTIRCDAPEKRRLFELRLASPDGISVTVTSRTLHLEERAAVALWRADAPRGDGSVRSCSWCKKVLVAGDRWEEVEEAVELLGLLRGRALPLLSHGICPPCDRNIRLAAGLEAPPE